MVIINADEDKRERINKLIKKLKTYANKQTKKKYCGEI